MTWLEIILLSVFGAMVLFGIAAAFSARLMVKPYRTPLWTDPKEACGLAFEDVAFDATDGVPIKGWFVPAEQAGPAPTILLLHGWPWNRIGTRQDRALSDFPGGKPVDLMPLLAAYHAAGYAVLMYDIRNFGQSGGDGLYTAGWLEHRDLLGAIDYLDTRDDVDPDRLGAVGFSNGGNCIVFALAHTDRLNAGIAIQPTTVSVFMGNFTRPFGPIGRMLGKATQLFYSLRGGPKLSHIQPTQALIGAAQTPMLYVQSTGDRWGTRADVEAMIDATPVAEGYFPETEHRFEGYQHMVAHPKRSLDFLARHMGGTDAS